MTPRATNSSSATTFDEEIAMDRDDGPDQMDQQPAWWERVLAKPVTGVGGGLVVIIVVFAAIAPHAFLTVSNAQNLALDNSTLVIVAMAVGLVMISGGFDLSAGSVIAVTQVVTALTFKALGGTEGGPLCILSGLLVAVLSGTLWGTLNGILVTRLSIPPFIATLATAGIAFGIAEVITNGTNQSDVPQSLVTTVGLGDVAGVPTLVIIAVVVVLLTAYLLRRTRFGQRIYAIGSDSTAAARVGINVPGYRVRIYALAGSAYGLVAFLDMARLSTSTVAGYGDIALFAISAVAIGGGSLFGGTGTALGVFIGVTIPAVLHNGLAITGIPSYYEQIGVGIALILAVYADHIRRTAVRLT